MGLRQTHLSCKTSVDCLDKKISGSLQRGLVIRLAHGVSRCGVFRLCVVACGVCFQVCA